MGGLILSHQHNIVFSLWIRAHTHTVCSQAVLDGTHCLPSVITSVRLELTWKGGIIDKKERDCPLCILVSVILSICRAEAMSWMA